jgi:type I restriction enzyme S subunit
VSHHKPYPAYKKSETDWVSKIPTHWQPFRLKRLAKIKNGQDYKDVADANGAYPVIGSGGEFARASSFLYNGKSVLLGRKGTIDRPLYVDGPFWAVDTMFYTELLPNACPKYVYYSALNIPFSYYSTNTALPSMTQEALSSHAVFAPSRDEQAEIALALDRETSRIDALISKKSRFIELLKEKRQALITRAVTKGLDPNARMKNSKAEWIGEMPAHWTVPRIKHCLQLVGQGWSPQCESYPAEEGQWGVLKVGCVNGGTFDRTENKALPKEMDPQPELSLNAGDLLISRANTRELVGSAAVVKRDEPKLLLCDKLYRFRADPAVSDVGFVALYLGTPGVRGQVEIEATGTSSSMLNISQATILELILPLPPLAEQSEIVAYVEKEVGRLER